VRVCASPSLQTACALCLLVVLEPFVDSLAFILLITQWLFFPKLPKPSDNSTESALPPQNILKVMHKSWKQILTSRKALACVVYVILFDSCLSTVLTNYGVWLSEVYGLGSHEVGLTAIGIAGIIGALLNFITPIAHTRPHVGQL